MLAGEGGASAPPEAARSVECESRQREQERDQDESYEEEAKPHLVYAGCATASPAGT